MGSERPENCPVDSFQWRTGGSPGKGVATIEDADICQRQKRPERVNRSKQRVEASAMPAAPTEIAGCSMLVSR